MIDLSVNMSMLIVGLIMGAIMFGPSDANLDKIKIHNTAIAECQETLPRNQVCEISATVIAAESE